MPLFRHPSRSPSEGPFPRLHPPPGQEPPQSRLARPDAGPQLPLHGHSHAPARGRRWALPLLWEFGIPAVIAVLPARLKVGWKGMFLYGPDVSYALTAIGSLAALTGLVRIAKAGRALRGKTPSP
jgi:hypothetical protein